MEKERKRLTSGQKNKIELEKIGQKKRANEEEIQEEVNRKLKAKIIEETRVIQRKGQEFEQTIFTDSKEALRELKKM
jgi:hypothetical protein